VAALAEPNPRVRKRLERAIGDEVGEFLGKELERVLEAVTEQGQALPEDEGFWREERGLLIAALMPALIGALNALGEEEAAAVGLGGMWGEVNAEALAWVREYTFNLVKDLTETSRGALREALETWYQAGAGDVADLREMLAPTFGETRAQAIAATEVTRANAAATRVIGGEIGVTYALQPPAHPNCRCWTVTRALPDGSLVGVWETAMDERVNRVPVVATPWGGVASDADLQDVVVSEGPWLGRKYNEAAAEVEAGMGGEW